MIKKRAFLFIIIAGVLWGTSGLFVAALEPMGYTAPQMSAMRGTVAFLCFAVYALVKCRSVFATDVKTLLLYVGLGLSLFGTGTFYFVSMQMTSVSTAVVLMYMAPIYVTVFSVLFFNEKMTLLKGFSIIVMLVGCALVSGIVGGFKFDALGVFMGFMAGVSYGSYNILTKIAMRKQKHPVSTTMYGAGFMAVIALGSCNLPSLVKIALDKPLLSAVLIVGIGIVTFVLPYFLYTVAMRDLCAGEASTLAIIEPMSATLFGLCLGQYPAPLCYVGIVLILFAVVLLGRGENEKTDSKTVTK